MTRVFESKKVCATMFVLLAMSVAVNGFSGGSMPSFGSSPVLAPDAQHLIADSPFGGPDPFEREEFQIADSPFGGPDPFEREEFQIADSPFGGPDPFEREERA
jgi:hypothetical protein